MGNEKLFHDILNRLYSTGVLEDLILIGGSVNGVKEVFKCFGCDKKGTVIDACSFFENVGIGEPCGYYKRELLRLNLNNITIL